MDPRLLRHYERELQYLRGRYGSQSGASQKQQK